MFLLCNIFYFFLSVVPKVSLQNFFPQVAIVPHSGVVHASWPPSYSISDQPSAVCNNLCDGCSKCIRTCIYTHLDFTFWPSWSDQLNIQCKWSWPCGWWCPSFCYNVIGQYGIKSLMAKWRHWSIGIYLYLLEEFCWKLFLPFFFLQTFRWFFSRLNTVLAMY